MSRIKKALKRDPNAPVGEYAAVHVDCDCGEHVTIDGEWNVCDCGLVYSPSGWLLAKLTHACPACGEFDCLHGDPQIENG